MTGNLTMVRSFGNKLTFRTFRLCLRQYGVLTNSSKSLQYLPYEGSKIINKPLVDSLKNRRFDCNLKKYCSSHGGRTVLMNFETVTSPSFINTIRMAIFNFFTVKNIDESFVMEEFIEATKAVLEIVTSLLSESRFKQLEGLLTDDCKAEVERNVRALQPTQRLGLAVKAEDIFYSFPYNVDVIRDSVNGEKTFVQLTVVHHSCTNFAQVMQKPPFERMMEGTLEMLTIYNCRFIREFTQGVNDQWTINAINVYKLHEDRNYRGF